MRALVLEEQDRIRIRDIEVNETVGPDDVKIKIAAVGICGSDVHYYKHGRIGDFVVREPMILGHEASGIIAEVGKNVTNFKPGDRVCMEPGIPNWLSRESMLGMYNIDPSVRFWATPPVHGCLCDSVVHPANLTFKIPDHMTFDEAVMVEPLTLGVHVARKVGVVPGDTAIVTGAGPIGVIIALAALASGCSKVIITDVVQEKLDLVENAYGGRIMPFNVAKGDLKQFVSEHFPYGADILFEASGSAKAITSAPEFVAAGGKIVLIGMPQGTTPIDVVALQVKEIVTYSIFRYANDYQRAINFIASGQIDVKPLIHKHYNFEDSVAAFDFAASAPPGVIKTIINMM
ncbi:MAG TPA: NAD(P)-dependent alcohol dehydrogenase [Ensifer sp.]|jgi:D-xylulose reductase|uniref:NAD(P)-dependent alcohol dehydrogenase n=1 Tax=Ensifer sp. TaxID=1872086 RepID=UPI002E11512C|nr:NAD(P)-dependent alcohol dehydrogenase [Ensifer sp.]